MDTSDETPVIAYPRRARRKSETRERIISAAQQLIGSRGYAETTMADIATAADIHVTTLFTHFKSKKELTTAMTEGATALLETAVRASIGKVPFFAFVGLLIKGWARSEQEAGSRNLRYGYELRSDPELAFSWLQYQKREVTLLAEYVAADYGLDASTDLRPVLVANMVSVGNVIAHERWLDTGGKSDLEHDALAALEACKRLVGPALAALTQAS
jgi:AcrR family transcriptional regulator